MSIAYACEVCDELDTQWRIMRIGDVAVSWACSGHLGDVCDRMQRDHEVTKLQVTHAHKGREWAEMSHAMRQIGTEDDSESEVPTPQPSAEVKPAKEQVVDLMAALERSVADAKAARMRHPHAGESEVKP